MFVVLSTYFICVILLVLSISALYLKSNISLKMSTMCVCVCVCVYFYSGNDYIRLYISLKITRNKIQLRKGKPTGML